MNAQNLITSTQEMKQNYAPVQKTTEVINVNEIPEQKINLKYLEGFPIQRKLTIGAVDDSLEDEADNMADKVMRMRKQNFIQRKCAHCEEKEKLQRKPLASFIQKKETDSNSVASDTISSQIQLTKSSGNAIPASTKSFMESRFDTDFSNVNIHTDNDASQLSNQLNAQAFTVGNNIYFNEGKYQPESSTGKHLLAHELTHVMQQKNVLQTDTLNHSFVQRACLPEAECTTTIVKGSASKQFGEAMETAAAPVRKEILTEAPQTAQLRFHGHVATETETILQNRLPELRKLIHHIIIDETLPSEAGAAHVSNCSAWAEQNLRPDADKSAFTGSKLGCILVPKDFEENAALYNRTITKPGAAEKPDVEDALQWYILRNLIHEITHQRVETSNITYFADKKCAKENVQREVSELAANISEFPAVNNLNNPVGFRAAWIKAKLTDKRDPSNPTESIAASIHDLRCSCACTDADALIREAFAVASSDWIKKDKNDFHLLMRSKQMADLHIYWPFEVYGGGRDEFSLTLGSTGFDTLDMAMITYRHVMHQWVNGKLKLSVGLEGNLASPLHGGEFGAGTVGLEYVASPVTKYKAAPGFIGRLDTGLGIGEFAIQSGDEAGTEMALKRDVFLQLSGGVHFYIPHGNSMIPASIEAAYRLTQPIGGDAERIKTASLILTISLPESK